MRARGEPPRLPAGLEEEIDALVGRRGRSAFLREAVRQEIERRRVLGSRPNIGGKSGSAKRGSGAMR